MTTVSWLRGAFRGVSRPACLLLALALLPAGCSPSATLTHTFASDEALARAVLDGVARNDREGLLEISLTKDEFEGIVWPTLRVSRPEVGMPMDFVWRDTFTKSRAYLAATLSQAGGQRFELVRVDLRGETTDHGTYTVSRKTHLVVRDAEGRERTIRLFGSIIRQNGGAKVYSYIVD